MRNRNGGSKVTGSKDGANLPVVSYGKVRDRWQIAALCAGSADAVFSAAMLLLALYSGDIMPVPGAAIRVALASTCIVFIACNRLWAYWLLGAMLLLAAIVLIPFSFMSFGGDTPVFDFSASLLGLALLYLVLGVAVVSAAVHRAAH